MAPEFALVHLVYDDNRTEHVNAMGIEVWSNANDEVGATGVVVLGWRQEDVKVVMDAMYPGKTYDTEDTSTLVDIFIYPWLRHEGYENNQHEAVIMLLFNLVSQGKITSILASTIAEFFAP